MKNVAKNQVVRKIYFLNQNPTVTLPHNLPGREKLDLQIFSNGLDLYQYLKSGHPPDALLLELNQHAYDFLSLLRQDPFLHKKPIILVSDKVSLDSISKARALAVDDIFAANNLKQDFLFRLNYLIRKYQLQNNRIHLNVSKTVISPALIRQLNIALAGATLMVLSPIIALLALLIKLNYKGTVWSASKRWGVNNKISDYYSFRTANGVLTETSDLKAETNIESDLRSKKISTDTASHFGYWLEKSGLYKLPGLVNIWRGETTWFALSPQPLLSTSKVNLDIYHYRFVAPVGRKKYAQVLAEEETLQPVPETTLANSFNGREIDIWLNFKTLLKAFPVMPNKAALLSSAKQNDNGQPLAAYH